MRSLACGLGALTLAGAASTALADSSNVVTYESVATSSSDETTNSVCCGGLPTSLESKVSHSVYQHHVWSAGADASAEDVPGLATFNANFAATWTEVKTTITINKGWAACKDHRVVPSVSTETDTLESTASQSGAAELVVQHILLDPASLTSAGGLFSIRASAPGQPSTGTVKVVMHFEGVDPCGGGSKPPPDRTNSGPWSPSASLVNLSNLQADDSGYLVGTQSQSLPFEHGTNTVTITWNAGAPDQSCEALHAQVDLARTRLQTDTAALRSMLDQINGMANAAQALATGTDPGAVPSIVDVSNGLTQLTASGGDDSGFATASGAWAQGTAAQQVAVLQGEIGSPVAGPLLAQLAGMLQAAQGPAMTAAADADALTQAQTELAACQ